MWSVEGQLQPDTPQARDNGAQGAPPPQKIMQQALSAKMDTVGSGLGCWDYCTQWFALVIF